MARIDKKLLLDDLIRIKNITGHIPSREEYKAKGGLYSARSFRTVFGSWGNALKLLGYTPQKGGGFNRMRPPQIEREAYTDYMTLNADKAVIAFDTHIPYHDHNLFNELIDFSIKKDIKTLVIGGDFLDFKGLYNKEPQSARISWIEEIEEAIRVLEDLCQHFDNIYIIEGNHDRRLLRVLGDSNKTAKLYELIFKNEKVKFSKYQYIYINDWLQILHSGNSKIKLSKVEKIVNVSRKSTIVGHSHRFCFGIHDSGHEVLGEGLHMTRPELHEYKNITINDYSEWIQGWWVMENDKVYPVVKHARVGEVYGI